MHFAVDDSGPRNALGLKQSQHDVFSGQHKPRCASIEPLDSCKKYLDKKNQTMLDSRSNAVFQWPADAEVLSVSAQSLIVHGLCAVVKNSSLIVAQSIHRLAIGNVIIADVSNDFLSISLLHFRHSFRCVWHEYCAKSRCRKWKYVPLLQSPNFRRTQHGEQSEPERQSAVRFGLR